MPEAIPISITGGEFLTVIELKTWLSRTIADVDITQISTSDVSNIIKEKESDVQGLLSVKGVTVSSTRATNPIAYDIVKATVRYGAAMDCLPGMLNQMTAEEYGTVKYWKSQWLRARDQIRDNPKWLSDATFGTGGSSETDYSDNQRGWLRTDVNYPDEAFTVRMTF